MRVHIVPIHGRVKSVTPRYARVDVTASSNPVGKYQALPRGSGAGRNSKHHPEKWVSSHCQKRHHGSCFNLPCTCTCHQEFVPAKGV
jgi:hypothetical protein